MNLKDNPIFLTQKRLVHRGGVLAAILIAALIGASLLSGLVAYLSDPTNFPSIHSPREAGKMFYGWTIGVEILVLIVAGFSRISRALADERKAGLWDSNRLTPLKPSQLVTGYWFGSALREFYMGAILAGIGLAIVLLARLPVTLWFGTQVLIFSTALFLGLFAVLVGMTFQRPLGILILLPLFFGWTFSFIAPSRILTNFLLPVYGIANLFINGNFENNNSLRDWNHFPEIFGLRIYPILLSLGLQLIIGIFFWRAAVRKTANPFQPLLLRWEAVALFGILVIAQHGLIWGLWRGQFPKMANHEFYDHVPLLSIVHGGTILLATLVLAFASPQPENVRVAALRLGFKNPGAIFSRSAISLALALVAVTGVVLLAQCALSLADSWKNYVIALGNLLDFSLIFALLLEFCRLRFRRRALGFVALWLFIFCALPFILAAVFSNETLAQFSILSPGVIALDKPDVDELNCLLWTVLAHFGIVVLLFIAWQRQWNRLLAKTAVP